MIDIYFGNRRSGRTTRLITWLCDGEPDNKRVILVHSESEASRLRKIAIKLQPTIEDWQITSRSSDNTLRGRKFSEVAIDNLEVQLPNVGAPITMVMATRYQDPSPHSPAAIQHGFVVHES